MFCLLPFFPFFPVTQIYSTVGVNQYQIQVVGEWKGDLHSKWKGFQPWRISCLGECLEIFGELSLVIATVIVLICKRYFCLPKAIISGVARILAQAWTITHVLQHGMKDISSIDLDAKFYTNEGVYEQEGWRKAFFGLHWCFSVIL